MIELFYIYQMQYDQEKNEQKMVKIGLGSYQSYQSAIDDLPRWHKSDNKSLTTDYCCYTIVKDVEPRLLLVPATSPGRPDSIVQVVKHVTVETEHKLTVKE